MQGFELKAGARKIMQDNAPKIFFVGIVFIVISTVMSELQFRMPGITDAYDRFLDQVNSGELPGLRLLCANFRPVGAVLAAVLALLRPIVEVGYLSYCLKLTRSRGGDYKDILDGFLFFGKAILIFVITSVLCALWSLLLIFPGIVAYYRYRQAYYILLDAPEKSAMQCIRESKQLMAGNKLDLFLIDLSFIGWYILDTLVIIIILLLIPVPVALPLVSIWLTPYKGLTLAAYYSKLESRILV